jgi:hypothetical protein
MGLVISYTGKGTEDKNPVVENDHKFTETEGISTSMCHENIKQNHSVT